MNTTPHLSLRAIPVALWSLVAFAALAGCQSGSVPISGKVIQGPISFVGAVDSADPRLKGPGLEGAKIDARGMVENQPAVALGEVTSDKDGNFRLDVKEQKAFIRPAQFNARKDGYLAASETLPIPTTDRRLLVILKPDAATSRAK